MKACVLMTLNSAFLFSFLIVSTSLFPCTIPSDIVSGFSSYDVSTVIAVLLGCYLLQIALYLTGVNAIKYVMGIFCGAGLIMVFSIIISTVLRGWSAESPAGFVIVFIFGAITLLANILWYRAAFRSTPD